MKTQVVRVSTEVFESIAREVRFGESFDDALRRRLGFGPAARVVKGPRPKLPFKAVSTPPKVKRRK